MPLGGRLARNRAFDVEQLSDFCQRLLGEGRAIALVLIEELAPDMRPACHLRNQRRLTAFLFVKFAKAGIAIGVQMPFERGKMLAAALTLPVWRVAVEHRRRCGAGMRPFVAKIDPEPAFLGLAVAGGEHRHGRVIGVDDAARHDVAADPVRQRLHQPGGLANPARQRGAVEFHAVAGVNLSLAVKRQVIAELRDQHMSQKAGSACARGMGKRWHRHLRHRLAFAAGAGGADMADHFEAAGNVFEDFGDVLAHFAHETAANRTGAGRFVNNIAARQRFGQLAPLLLRRCLFLRRLGGLRCRRGSGRRFRLGLRRLDLFELEFELLQFAPHALRGGAEGHALQARNLSFQLFGFKRLQQKASLGGIALRCPQRHKPLEFFDIVGKTCRIRHEAKLSASRV